MKKIIIVTLLLTFILIPTACSSSEIEPVFSLAQKDVLFSGDDDFYVTIVSGTRETPLIMDGKTDATEDFTTLTVLPLHFDLFDKSYSFTVAGDKASFSGELTREKTGSGYVSDIKNVSTLGKINLITIKSPDSEYSFSPERSIGDFTYLKAYQKAKETFAATLQAESKNGISREVIVKYVSDGKSKDSPFYWYVSFLKSDDDFLSVLLDGNTGKIIAQRG